MSVSDGLLGIRWSGLVVCKHQGHMRLSPSALIHPAGSVIIQPPARCPRGHILGPNEVLVGHPACLGHGGGHTTWTCRTCDQTVYGPPLNTHCTTLDGPATVRLSNQRYPQRDYEHSP